MKTSAKKELYRDDQGHEVWRIVEADGTVAGEGITSDHDASWLFREVGGIYCAECDAELNPGETCFCGKVEA